MRDHIYKKQCHKLPTSVICDLSPLVGIQDSDARVRKPTPSPARSPLKYELSDKRQTEIIVTKIAPERKKYLDELAAMACYNEA